MGKIKKKGTSGQAKNYITRTQAIRKLQISLPDFRRLCIFKGIYPREPRSYKKASKSSTQATTFYYTRDIQYLLHEPLLAKFREQKSVNKKIARSLGRNEVGDAVRLEKYATPKITLDHIVRERYPTFVDALRDLDDALSLLFLFANLPSTTSVPAKVVARCQRLCHEFEHYLISTNSLRKSFLSIKGIYYQATIQGQDIMWLVPYKFVQQTSIDVDYRIMGTFVQFYSTLLGFVNFRLYTTIGLVYPPKFNVETDEGGAELSAFTLEGREVKALEAEQPVKAITNGHAQTGNQGEVQKILDRVAQLEETDQQQEETAVVQENNEAIDTFENAVDGGDTLAQPDVDQSQAAALFADFTFYISREAPRHPIEFLLRAFGCKRIGWDPVLGEGSFTTDESDSRITHQIVDRPLPPVQSSTDPNDEENDPPIVVSGSRYPGRIYIQPQWIWDCVNETRLLPTNDYAPGETLPPHLSPWVKGAPGQYDPRAPLAEQEPDGEAQEALENMQQGPGESDDNENMQIAGSEEVGSVEDDQDGLDNDFATFDDDDQDEDDDEEAEEDEAEAEVEEDDEASGDEATHLSQHQAELEAEAAGQANTNNRPATTTSSTTPGPAAKKRAQQKKAADEELSRQKMMMSNKKRKLFEKMHYGNAKREEEARRLRGKRRRLEGEKGGK